MGMNETPSSERIHISFFGCRNAGKSSLLNAVTGQDFAVVSNVKGTTTDPVKKSMELLPIGPVVIIDTPGMDDEGSLGELRMKKTRQILRQTDIAVLVADSQAGIRKEDRDLIVLLKERKIPFLIALNKSELGDLREEERGELEKLSVPLVPVSAVTGAGIQELKEALTHLRKGEGDFPSVPLIGDLISPSDFVVLVVPIDKASPKGRLILPQQQTIRAILDAGAVSITVRDDELEQTLSALGKKPKLIVTDSQIFNRVKEIVPEDILLTSFSILFARYKGSLKAAAEGAAALEQLKDGDRILICEGCTHHRQCGDIGTEKLPLWIKNYTEKTLAFDFTSGADFPDDLSPYRLIVHCGGCMLNEREMKYRQSCAAAQKVPITNYGIAIAHLNGILKRSVELFPDIMDIV